MARQQYGVTGRKQPSPLLNLIRAQTPYLRERKTLEEEKQFRAEEFSLMTQALDLQEEQARKAAKIAETGLVTSTALGLASLAPEGTAGTVVGGIKGVLGMGAGGSATAEAAAGVSGIKMGAATSQAILTGTAGGKWATAAKYGFPIAAAAGLEAVRGNIGEYTEAQIGTSAGHVVDIGGRALQGAALGAPFGMAIPGAIIGGIAGVLEEAWDWLFGSSDAEPGGVGGSKLGLAKPR